MDVLTFMKQYGKTFWSYWPEHVNIGFTPAGGSIPETGLMFSKEKSRDYKVFIVPETKIKGTWKRFKLLELHERGLVNRHNESRFFQLLYRTDLIPKERVKLDDSIQQGLIVWHNKDLVYKLRR